MAPAEPTPLEDLPVRPPTPPREANKYVDDALQFLSDSFEVDEALGEAPALAAPACVDTPPQQSPASSVGRANDSARRKKVDFSPWTAYHSANDMAAFRRGLPGSPLRPLPQPRDPRTLKSILKAHDPPAAQPSTPTHGRAASTPNGFATMMETLVKQLAGQSRLHRIDAYMALVTTLKTYDGKPDAKTLADKMGLLAQFMQRDMTSTNAQTGGLDVQLALQAIKLLVALMEAGLVADRIPDTFRTFFLDKAIETFADPTAPKQWVNHTLHAFSQQRFAKSMNLDRANRAVAALKDIEDRVSGNNVVICRMMAYRTLLDQQKLVMVDRAADWLQHVFHGLLSSNKDIRMRAIELGAVTGISVGKEDEKLRVSRVTMEILAKPIDGGRTYGDYFTDRLLEMLSDAQTAEHVPHVWASVVLLLRNRQHKLEAWKLLRKWLQVFQKCVNSSNKEVAIQANGAWNRFVYAVRPSQHTSVPFRNLLRQALVAQFERKSSDKDGLRMKRSAFSSYCNLLYYSLSPTAPTEQLDLYWQEFVVEVLPTMAKRDRKGALMACKVLAALFKRNRTKIWRENLAVESATITLDNIIALDPRWTRHRLRNVLGPFELCFASAPWACTSPSEELASESPVKSMWSSLMATVAEAGSKEVTASMDFKEACACVVNFLHRLWTNYPKSFYQGDDSGQTWIEKFAFIVLTAVDQLGPGSFADPMLSRTPAENFEVAPTPSHRSQSRGGLQSPLLHLLHLFANNAPGAVETSARVQLSCRLLELCCQAKTSRKSKLDLLRACVQASTSSTDESFRSGIWRNCAQLAQLYLRNSGLPTAADRASQSLGAEYSSALDILAAGLDCGVEGNANVAGALYDALVSRIQDEISDGAGTAAVALVITEPLAERLQSAPSSSNGDTVTQFSTLLLRHTEHPRHRKTVEQARRSLWGMNTPPQKPSEFDPFNHLYKMVVARLHWSYEMLQCLSGDLVIAFAVEVGALLQRWPKSCAAVLLRKIQDGIAVWVRDLERKLSGDTDGVKGGREAVYALWDIVMNTVETLPRHDDLLLMALDVLLTAGLRSERKRIVNRTIETWNRTFGSQTSLKYPLGVEKGLRRLQPIVDLELPDFPDLQSDQESEPLPTFENSQDDIVSETLDLTRYGSSPARDGRTGVFSSLDRPHTTLTRNGQGSSASTAEAKAKLRHDNSQITFEPIESSPMGREEIDSQLLTEHQKDVREGQQEIAAMFPDINSSTPKQRKRIADFPAYVRSGQSYKIYEDAEPDSTPLYSLREYTAQQEALTSSPTPRSRKQSDTDFISEAQYLMSSTAEELFDMNMPSSPPEIDDERCRPDFSSAFADRFVEQRHVSESDAPQLVGGLEQLDADVVAQLVGDVSNLSDANSEKAERPLSPISISEYESDLDLSSSEINEEVSQQLENEVIAQALRQNRAKSMKSQQAFTGETTTDLDRQDSPSAEISSDRLHVRTRQSEGISSSDDKGVDPLQGAAGSHAETNFDKAGVRDRHIEQDPSPFSLPIRASPGKTRVVLHPMPSKAPVDETVIEDSFVAKASEEARHHGSKELNQTNEQSSSSGASANEKQHMKRKSLTAIDGSLAKKRPRKDDLSSSDRPKDGSLQADSDSDESVFSNNQADCHDRNEPMRDNATTCPEKIEDAAYLASKSGSTSDETLRSSGRRATGSSKGGPGSPKASGTVPEPSGPSTRTNKSRISRSQTTEADLNASQDATGHSDGVSVKAPARKRRRGRPSGASTVRKTTRASDAASSAARSQPGSRQPTPHEGFPATEESTAGTRTRGRRRSGFSQSTRRTNGEAAAQQKKRKRSNDGTESASGTTEAGTQASQQSTDSASQASLPGSGQTGDISQRPKAQPQSIIQRLKRLVADCKKVVLRQDDVAEIEQIMLEVKREVNAAAQRGDEQSGS